VIGELRASLYDLFEYFIPGAVLAVALYLLLAIPCSVHAPLDLAVFQHREALASALVLSYLAGHLVHALGNQLPWLGWSPEEFVLGPHTSPGAGQEKALQSPLVEHALRHIRLRYGIDPNRLSPRECYGLMDESRVLLDREGDREIYVYREGFYRAMTVAAAVLAIGLAARAVVGPLCFHWQDYNTCIGRSQLWIATGLCAVAIPGFAARLRRFGRYRVETAMLRWLVLSTVKPRADITPRSQEDPK
jgi:hypothetical protein